MKKLIVGGMAAWVLAAGCGDDENGGGTGVVNGGATAGATAGATGQTAGTTTAGTTTAGTTAGTAGTTAGTAGTTAGTAGTTAGTAGTTGDDGGVGTGGDGGSTSTGGSGLPSGEDYDGWTWVETPGAVCRDGSPAGYYYREGSAKNLYIFLNGGGACADSFFCGLNPPNVERDLPHERLINATGALLLGPDYARQQPPNSGMFKAEADNPVGDWSGIYVPYCTGDVHAGTRKGVTVPGVSGTQNFTGYLNLGLFLDEFGPHFSDADKVLLTGSSAGSFGALFNFVRVQEFFDQWGVPVQVVADSGIPMRDGVSDSSVDPDPIDYMAPCLQSSWRELWGLNDALPADCTACKGSGGGISAALGDYIWSNYGDRMLGGFLSTKEDNVMRGFFGAGGDPYDPASNCGNTDPALNVIIEATTGGHYGPDKYHRGLRDAVDNIPGRDNIGYFVMDGDLHMHLWRDRFYETQMGTSIAAWLGKVLNGEAAHVGDLDSGL